MYIVEENRKDKIYFDNLNQRFVDRVDDLLRNELCADEKLRLIREELEEVSTLKSNLKPYRIANEYGEERL